MVLEKLLSRGKKKWVVELGKALVIPFNIFIDGKYHYVKVVKMKQLFKHR
jgi:hypothetical protein